MEFRIVCGEVSPELTAAASRMILETFGGYFRAEGFGGYTFEDGRQIEESAIAWTIATAKPEIEIRQFVAAFARAYCAAGNQESVYFADTGGRVCFVDAGGRFVSI